MTAVSDRMEWGWKQNFILPGQGGMEGKFCWDESETGWRWAGMDINVRGKVGMSGISVPMQNSSYNKKLKQQLQS